MPTVLRIGSLRFHFYSDEMREPSHIHVATPDGECRTNLKIGSEAKESGNRGRQGVKGKSPGIVAELL